MSALGKDVVDGEEEDAEGEAVLGAGDAELVDALLDLFDGEEGDEEPAQEAGFGSDEQRKAVFANLADQGAEGHGSRFRIARLPAVTKIIKNIRFLRKAINSKKWNASDKPMTKSELVSARASYRRAVGELRSTVAEYVDDGYSGAKGAYKAAGIGEADVTIPGDVIRAGGFGEAEEAAIAGDFVPLVERAVRADSTIPVKIIAPGWGSSGHYSPDVLKRDGPRVFRKGTKMFWNHQTPADEAARPEGDLRDLAGEFVSDAVWKDDGLYADAKVFGPYREAVNELAPYIGVSIRALGKAKAGEADGRKGNLIEQIVAAKSVDFVTTPGAGGKVLELFESARRAVPESTEVVDMDEVKKLTEANAALEAEKAALLQEMAQLREHVLLGDARGVVAEALGKADLPDITKARLAEALAKNPPAKDGKLDAEGFATRIAEAIKAEQEYIGKILGAGRITGMGGSAPAEDGAGAQGRLAEAFKGLGLNEQAAKRAADGRF